MLRQDHPKLRHRWDVSPRQAVRIQVQLAKKVVICPLENNAERVLGADMAFSTDGRMCIAGVVLWDIRRSCILEQAVVRQETRFPYVPGLLSFRESPAVLAAIRKIKSDYDVLMLDGQGIAHPRRIGLASHLGIWLDRPSIGCAKSRLCGIHLEPPADRGAFVPLIDKDEQVGVILRTRPGIKPLYVSVGHRVTLTDAIQVVMECCTRYRLPEPTRLAHQLVTRERSQVI